EPRRAGEPGQVPDVRARGHQQPVQLGGGEGPDERLLPRAPPISTHAGTRDTPPDPRVPADSSRRRTRSPHPPRRPPAPSGDRKSTRLNSSHGSISYAVFCLKKKKQHKAHRQTDTTKK